MGIWSFEKMYFLRVTHHLNLGQNTDRCRLLLKTDSWSIHESLVNQSHLDIANLNTFKAELCADDFWVPVQIILTLYLNYSVGKPMLTGMLTK